MSLSTPSTWNLRDHVIRKNMGVAGEQSYNSLPSHTKVMTELICLTCTDCQKVQCRIIVDDFTQEVYD